MALTPKLSCFSRKVSYRDRQRDISLEQIGLILRLTNVFWSSTFPPPRCPDFLAPVTTAQQTGVFEQSA